MLSIIDILLASSNGGTSYFYGWDVLSFGWYWLTTFFYQNTWQGQASYIVIAICILMMFVLFYILFRKILQNQRFRKEYQEYAAKYTEAFREILCCREGMCLEEIEYICKADESELRETSYKISAKLIMAIRLELANEFFIPNLQRLCNILGITEASENQLIKGENVQETLQVLVILPLRVKEGTLARYLNSNDHNVRNLARTYYALCSRTESTYYIEQDINESFEPWYPTIFHRTLGWHKEKGHPMPSLLALAKLSNNDEKQSLFISEIPYWGSDADKQELKTMLNSTKPQCRLATIKALAKIGDTSIEDYLIEHYSSFFPEEKRVALQAIADLNSGKQADFFRQVYEGTTSQHTRAIALNCLYHYGETGKKIFLELMGRGNEEDSKVFEQTMTQS